MTENEQDFFICHASEDKEDVAQPLAEALATRGAKVWYDDWTLQIGDSLIRKIDEGLATSCFGVVILSPNFFEKEWPQKELAGLVQKEVDGRKVILPIRHKISVSEVRAKSLILADKLAPSTANGIPAIALELMEVAGIEIGNGTDPTDEPIKGPASVKIGLDHVSITDALHIYSLSCKVTLHSPHDQGRLKLSLMWPEWIETTRLESVDEGQRCLKDTTDYRHLTVIYEKRVFPDETVSILGGDSPHHIEYRFVDKTYRRLRREPVSLPWKLYFEDHGRMKGSVPFEQLHEY